MVSYYLTCRSLTYAQKTARVLDSAGVHNRVARTIQGMSSEGCGYATVVREGTLVRALAALEKAGLPPKKVFSVRDGKGIEEVDI